MIRVEGLKKSFGKLTVLDNLDLQIARGGIFVILGPNGSGKTTLIKSVLGMVVPDAGKISIDGKSVIREWEYRGNIDYLPQIANFPSNLSVSELLKLVKELRDKPTRDQELIAHFGLEPFLDKKLGNLSGGTKQKVNLMLTFMFNSPLVILDEPTSGLDPIAMLHLKELIRAEKQNGKTVLITTHIMSFVEEIADEIVFLLDGKIYFKGSVQELQQKTGQKDFEHAIAAILRREHA
ncbi:MAG: ABC transporter ATP-binding protein [Flavobacteriales bacterium]|nr:ABC transporter ATP-binding protein [Flavobacteriales bacterium]